MQRAEVQAAGALAGEAIGGFGSLVAGMHEAISGRVFGALGPLGLPVRFVHDRLTDGAYRATRAGLAALPRGGAALAAARARSDAPALDTTPRGAAALSAINGAIGDRLLEQSNPLALTMAIRRRGEAVEPVADALAAAFPEATPRVAVFVHGLGGDEQWWWLGGRPSYGARLRDDRGYTPVYVRYNTGCHVSDNGRALAELLDELVANWPVDVEELALVGHSMGGLVARSASHMGEVDDHGWVGQLRHVVCLGSPHLGAPLEKAANLAGWTLNRLPEMRPFAKVVNGRSVGIKDLRFGSCAEADWCDCGRRRAADRPLHRGAVRRPRDLLLHRRDADGLGSAPDCARARRPPGSPAERLGSRPPPHHPLRGRPRPPPRRPDPLPPGEPPARVRAPAGLAFGLSAGRALATAGGGCSTFL